MESHFIECEGLVNGNLTTLWVWESGSIHSWHESTAKTVLDICWIPLVIIGVPTPRNIMNHLSSAFNYQIIQSISR